MSSSTGNGIEPSESTRCEFYERAFAYLRPINLDWGQFDEHSINSFIHTGVAQAAGLSISHEIDVIRYLELLLRLGPTRWKSKDYSWIHDYLGEKRKAAERLDIVTERLRFDFGTAL